MKLWLGLLVLAFMLFAGSAAAQPSRAANAREHVESARREGHYTFCNDNRGAYKPRKHDPLCPLAKEVQGCEGYAAACERDGPESLPSDQWERSPKGTITQILGQLAKGLVWLLVVLVIAAIAFPIIRALLRARRDKAVADAPAARNVASALVRPPPPEAENIADAEAALGEADAHARRGELARALSLYLAASLAALDRRGAIRLARHRTNGEYVRSCAEDEARLPLREIVREVDKVEFGKLAPTSEGVTRVAARANALVRASVLLLTLAIAGAGCGSPSGVSGKSDPAGDDLPIDVLRRSGYTVSYLSTSLAALPMPAEGAASPVVIVDVERVLLEDESSQHLVRWVREGGVLVLFGLPSLWPTALHAKAEITAARDLDVLDGYASGARVAVSRALSWPESEPIATIGKDLYAAQLSSGKGRVIGVAGHDLMTNIGVARPDNAAAFVALIGVAVHDRSGKFEIHVARLQDGIPPADDPFSSLVQAGLGKGAWHALAAAVVLFLAFGIRHARPRPSAKPARRAFAEHVEATGAFYGRARAVGHALASYGRFAEMRVRERVPRGADPVHFLATRAGVAPEDAARIWKRATEAKADDAPRGDELVVIRDLRAMLERAFESTMTK